MFEIFQYSFMNRAFIAGIIIAIAAPLIGTFLVTRRYSLISDTLSHITLAGIAIGLLLGIHPILSALIVVSVAALLIEKVRTQKGISGDMVLPLFLSGSLAFAIVVIGLGHGLNVNLFSYLFGSITTVTETDLWMILFLGSGVFGMVFFLYKEFLCISFDEEGAIASGIPVPILNSILLLLTAITVVISMRIVGILLISALMTIPVVTMMLIGKSFRQSILGAIGLSLISVISGLILAFYLNLAAGGTIVLISLCLFGIGTLIKK